MNKQLTAHAYATMNKQLTAHAYATHSNAIGSVQHDSIIGAVLRAYAE